VANAGDACVFTIALPSGVAITVSGPFSRIVAPLPAAARLTRPSLSLIPPRSGKSLRNSPSCGVSNVGPEMLRNSSAGSAATDDAMMRVSAQVASERMVGNREFRVSLHVQTRGRVCDEWLPLWRALNANQGDSPDLKNRIRLIRELVIRRLEEVYAPELSTLVERERRQTVLALEALVDFESWARLRGHFAMSFEEACDVWIRAIDRLLPETPPVS